MPIAKDLKEEIAKYASPKEERQPKFCCPICGQHYDTVEKMLDCFNQKPEKGPFKVGDIVLVSGKYWGWWQGKDKPEDDPWLACVRPAIPKSKDHFDHVIQYWPWFVITSLWQESHREVASLVSLMRGEVSEGWNPTVDTTHYMMWLEGKIEERTDYATHWKDHFEGVKIKPPSDRLRAEAAELAKEGYLFTDLL